MSAKLLLAPEWSLPTVGSVASSSGSESRHDSGETSDATVLVPAGGDLSEDNDLEDDKEVDESYPELVEQLNAVLPASIRAFSCRRVNKGFQARDACHWRYSVSHDLA